MQLSLVETTLWLDIPKLRMTDLCALSEEEVLRFFVGQRLLQNKMNCDKCGRTMRINKRAKLIDGIWWSCKQNRKQCTNKSIRSGSFFANSHLKFSQLLLLLYMWAKDYSNMQAAHETGISERHVVDWFNLCREVCQNYCHNQQMLGGAGRYIEIDESSISKRKYNRGRRRIGASQWVFGGVERGNGGLAFAFRVPDRKKKTLLRIIKKKILPGTTIISDEWPAYRTLGKQLGRSVGYKHFTIFHKRQFARTVVEEGENFRIHTNKCEGLWAHMKHKVKRLYGTSDANMAGYVQEAVFRQNCRAKEWDVFSKLFLQISLIYNV